MDSNTPNSWRIFTFLKEWEVPVICIRINRSWRCLTVVHGICYADFMTIWEIIAYKQLVKTNVSAKLREQIQKGGRPISPTKISESWDTYSPAEGSVSVDCAYELWTNLEFGKVDYQYECFHSVLFLPWTSA